MTDYGGEVDARGPGMGTGLGGAEVDAMDGGGVGVHIIQLSSYRTGWKCYVLLLGLPTPKLIAQVPGSPIVQLAVLNCLVTRKVVFRS